MEKISSARSFTLIEVLVTITIIGILSGILIATMGGATNAAQDAKRKSNIDQIRKALLIYKTRFGSYPQQASSCQVGNDASCAVLDAALKDNGYFSTIPTDPGGTYYSYISSDGTDFTLTGNLSNATSYSYNPTTGFSSGVAYSSTCVSVGGLNCAETADGSYVVYTYTYSGAPASTTWTPPAGVTQVDYLVVAGGGAGGSCGFFYSYGGGGGAGGLLAGTGFAVSGSTTISVGSAGSSATNGNGGSGQNSQFSTVTAIGGGGGGGCPSDGSSNAGLAGGSGGGGSSKNGGFSGPGSGTAGQGYAGGTGKSQYSGGGGGGAGAVGASNPSNGGVGIQSAITGTALYYAGGGGAIHGSGAGVGGLGYNNYGGGGTGYQTGPSVAGNAGVVIIRFLHP